MFLSLGTYRFSVYGCLLVAILGHLVGCSAGHDDPPSETGTRGEASTRAAAEEPQIVNAPLPGQQQRQTQRRPAEPEDWFAEVTDRWGIEFAYCDGSDAGFYVMLEQVGGGVALFDYTLDGRLDLYFTGGGQMSGPPLEIQGRPSGLFRNTAEGQYAEVAALAGLADPGFYTHGCAVGDFDGDGFADLLVAGYGGCRLYRNQGDGTFQDVTEAAGLQMDGWNVTAAWADYDGDGHLDLYVVTYAKWDPQQRKTCFSKPNVRDICNPVDFEGERDRLWRSRGDGTFEEVTEAAGLIPANRGLGVVAADLDDDGWIDFYVANDIQPNYLYYGGSELPLDSAGVFAGAAVSPTGRNEGSMGVDLGDYDGDGRPDLFYTNYAFEDNSLLQNTGSRSFLNVTGVTGIVGQSARWVGFGTAFADFDNDGWQDLFVTNGHVLYSGYHGPYFQPAQLFRNQQGERFVEVSEQGGPYFSIRHAGRGAAVGDLDNDGTLDLVVVHQNDPVAVLRNRHQSPHWVRVRLVGTVSNRDGVGAKVSTQYGQRRLTRWVRGGGGYLSHFDCRILFPAPQDGPVDVTVNWPSGSTEVFSGLAQRQTHELVEGMGRQP